MLDGPFQIALLTMLDVSDIKPRYTLLTFSSPTPHPVKNSSQSGDDFTPFKNPLSLKALECVYFPIEFSGSWKVFAHKGNGLGEVDA